MYLLNILKSHAESGERLHYLLLVLLQTGIFLKEINELKLGCHFGITVEPRLSGPLGTGPNSPDNRESG